MSVRYPLQSFVEKSFKEDIEGLFIEIDLKKGKQLLSENYQPSSQPHKYFFGSLAKALDVYWNYEKVLLVGGSRSSFLEMFFKKDVLKNFVKFTGKHLCQSFFFNKVAAVP